MVCFTQGHKHTKPACLPWFILAWKQFRAGTMGRSGARHNWDSTQSSTFGGYLHPSCENLAIICLKIPQIHMAGFFNKVTRRHRPFISLWQIKSEIWHEKRVFALFRQILRCNPSKVSGLDLGDNLPQQYLS